MGEKEQEGGWEREQPIEKYRTLLLPMGEKGGRWITRCGGGALDLRAE